MKKAYRTIGTLITVVLIGCGISSFFFPVTRSFCLNLVTEMIGIAFSVFVVEVLIRQHMKQKDWNESLHFDKQEMSRYIDLVRFEIKLAIEGLANNNPYDYSVLRRSLIDSPRFESFKPEKISPECHDSTIKAYNKFNEIENYLAGGNVSKLGLDKYYRELLHIQLAILKITKRQQSCDSK